MKDEVLVRVKDLKMHFPIRAGVLNRVVGAIKAVDGVTFDILKGETLGLVGESGCGKTTAGRTILHLYRPTGGEVSFRGVDLAKESPEYVRRARRHMQMIFQDPYASLNPQMRVGEIIGRPLRIHGLVRDAQEEKHLVTELMQKVGLNTSYRDRYPHEFSGGQRQRIGIARALATSPDFIVCDEAISALDVSIQAQIINLLEQLRDDLGLTYLFIAHDLGMVRYISTRVGVMYLGKMMELTSSDELYENPLHPYTKALLSAIPIPDPPLERQRRRMLLEGDLPSPSNPPAGCRFSSRCPLATDHCRTVEPKFREVTTRHWVACHLV
ncbi:MAG TPA: oligopeptide/dipeptide ABC transporter ATP-binding protein [Arsenicitalea sp.]|jgi:oligopeptide transport system ATP-binding protein|nr:oligopeptide/dipeptide ABC transporter ATP-binding protein [Arsenicitalea sp.]